MLSVKENIDNVSLNKLSIFVLNRPPFAGSFWATPVVLLNIFCCINNKCFCNFSSLSFSSRLF